MPPYSRMLLAVGLGSMAPGPAATEPLRLEQFFRGNLTGAGEVDNYRDGSHRAFTATLRANWSGPHGAETHGTLVEDLTYADGEKKHFAWSFDKTGEGQYVGHRDDLIHDADVFVEGDAIRMKYTAKTRLPDGKIWTLSFDDQTKQTSPTAVTVSGNISYLFVGVGVTRMAITKSGR